MHTEKERKVLRLIIITGFLGSGKTTLLLELVRGLMPYEPGRCVILENEVGEVDIDGAYLASRGLEVRELFAGCVCCQLAGSLVSTLEEIASTLAPAAVFLEASGMADPRRLLETLERYGRVVDKRLVISLADMERLPELLEVAEPMIRGQMGPADILVLNKMDLASLEEKSQAASRIAQFAPEAELLNVSATCGEGVGQLVEKVWDWWA